MNITTTVGSSGFRKPGAGGLPVSWAGAARWAQRSAQRLIALPMLLWLLIVAAGLLAFFVHLLNEQVLRGEMLREEQRAAATRPMARVVGNVQHPGNQLLVTRQAMTRP